MYNFFYTFILFLYLFSQIDFTLIWWVNSIAFYCYIFQISLWILITFYNHHHIMALNGKGSTHMGHFICKKSCMSCETPLFYVSTHRVWSRKLNRERWQLPSWYRSSPTGFLGSVTPAKATKAWLSWISFIVYPSGFDNKAPAKLIVTCKRLAWVGRVLDSAACYIDMACWLFWSVVGASSWFPALGVSLW